MPNLQALPTEVRSLPCVFPQNSLAKKCYLHSTDEDAWLPQPDPGRIQTQAWLIPKPTLGLSHPPGLAEENATRAKPCATWRSFPGY